MAMVGISAGGSGSVNGNYYNGQDNYYENNQYFYYNYQGNYYECYRVQGYNNNNPASYLIPSVLAVLLLVVIHL